MLPANRKRKLLSWHFMIFPVVHVFFKDTMQWANKINTIKHEQVDVRCKIYKMSYLDFIFECFWHEQIHGSWRNSSKRSTASAPRLNGRHSILLLNLNDFSKDKFLRILKLLKGLLSEVTVCLLIFFLWIHGAVNKVINFSTMKTISNISSNNVGWNHLCDELLSQNSSFWNIAIVNYPFCAK